MLTKLPLKGHLSPRVAFLLLFVLQSAVVWAQSPLIRHPEVVAGKTEVSIQALYHDAYGRLWAGTSFGLVEYNGAERKLYTKANGLLSDNITAIVMDPAGRVYAGHSNGKISRSVGMGWEALPLPKGAQFPDARISALHVLPNGMLMIGTSGAGLYLYQTGQWEHITQENGLSSGESAATDSEIDEIASLVEGVELGGTLASLPTIYCFYTEPKGTRIWMGSDAGLIFFEPAKKGKDRFSYLTMTNGLPDNIVRGISGGEGGQVWIAMQDSGLARVTPTGQVEPLRLPGLRSLSTLVVNQLGEIWLGSETIGVWRYRIQDKQLMSFSQIAPSVLTMQEDREGSLWFGTNKGLYQFCGYRFGFIAGREGLGNRNIYAVLADSKGNFWAGADSAFFRLTPKADGGLAVERIPLRAGADYFNAVSLLEAPDGRIAVGTYSGGLFLYNPETRALQRLTREANSLSDDNILGMTTDQQGELWLATLEGVSRLSLADGTPKVLKTYTQADGLAGNVVWTVFRDSKNRLWFGTDGYGLSVYENGAFTNPGTKAMSEMKIYSITEDDRGHIWFSTGGQGVFSYDGKAFKNYSFAQGLHDDTPKFIQHIGGNKLLMGTQFGLDILDAVSGAVAAFGADDGLAGIEPHVNAVFVDKNYRVWVGTTGGLVSYDPNSELPRTLPPQVRLLRFQIFLKDMPMEDGAEYAFNQNYLTFDFIGVSLLSPGQVRYRYQLEGFDPDWSAQTQQRSVTYSNLPPGQYTFRVQATTGNGIWSDEVWYSFRIRPPFWQTWWFISLSAIVLLGGGYVGFRWRVNAIQQKNRELEAKVQERTQELAEQKSIVEQKNRDITESIEYAKRLQTAILPDSDKIAAALPDSFVFYQPKDIVSGDFYWFGETQGHVFMAAVDCTGHGVPGAFMSVIGYNALNTTIEELGITDPAAILAQVDRQVVQTLRQDAVGSTTKDGMDICLVVYHPESRTLAYGGAYRPLIRRLGGVWDELKGDRFPIGGGQQENKKFTTHRFDVAPGDMVFLYSDGITDQFGGDKGRKFTGSRLKKLLEDNAHQPMPQLGQTLRTAYQDWKGAYEQLDDVMIIGIRF